MAGMDFEIHEDGMLDITAGNIHFRRIAPVINEQKSMPLSISVSPERDSVSYDFKEGNITLHIVKSDDELIISENVILNDPVHDIEPLGNALIENVKSKYVQGFGMEGPSGYFDISDNDLDSYGLIGLNNDESALSVYTTDHRRFTTLFSAKADKKIYRTENTLTCGIDLESTVSGNVKLPDIHFYLGSDIMTCMKHAAHNIASEMNARNVMDPAFHWCSWYYYYENMDQNILNGLLSDLKDRPIDFRYIQLDAGYVDHTGDWKEINQRYPEGLKKAAESILESGYKAGIWIAPFMIGDQSDTYKEHPDWIVRNKDGSPYIVFRSYTEPKIWGNTDNDYFVLDTTNPDAMDYIKQVFTDLRSYGFTLFKIDFLLWCMVDTSKVSRYDMSRTSVQILRDLLETIRTVIGDDSFLLASIAPYMACIGYADGVRIAGDMGAAWKGAYGPDNLLKELPYDNYFNNVFWQNDPDAVILRDYGTHLTDSETISLAFLQALSGGVITTSDPVERLPERRRELLDFIKPDEKVKAEMPFLVKDREEIVITHKLHAWNLLYVLNPTDHPINVFYKTDELFGAKALFQYRFNFNDGKAIESEKISYFSDSIAPHDSVLLFVTEKPLTERPTNMWHR